MVRCELGYICDVCGEDVEEIIHSDLYLRYVLGEVSRLELPQIPDGVDLGSLYELAEALAHQGVR